MKRAWLALLALALLLAPLGARAQDPNAPSPAAAPNRDVLQSGQILTLYDAEMLALQHNLQIEVERTRPLIAESQVGQASGAFDPLGFGEYGFEHRETPVASTVLAAFGTGASINEDEWTYSGGVAGAVPLGLKYSSAYVMTRLDSTSGFQALEKEFRPVWDNRITLPLLKDLGYNQLNVNVKRSRIAQDVSEEDFRRSLIDELALIDAAYWELAAARASESVAGKSLKTATDLLEQTKVQYEVGVVSKVRVTEAVAGVAEREVNLITAQNRSGNAQDDLLNRIAAPAAGEFATARISTEDPTYVEYEIDETAALDKAMRYRPELAAAESVVEDAELQLAFARNQRLPRLDLTASFSFTGLSGPPKTGVPLRDTEARQSHDDFFRASGDHGWSAGGRFEIPIGNRTASYTVSQREIELRRSETQRHRVEQQVILDVRRAARTLRSAVRALEATERRRLAQEETLRAEQERLRLGDSTPFSVLEREEDLAEAEREKLTALQVYRNSIVALERAQGSLLETRGISVEQALY